MVEDEALAQVVAETANLKASGVTGGADAPEVRAQVTPGMDPGDANRITLQNSQLDRDQAQPALSDGNHGDLLADLKQFASSPQGQALAQVQQQPVDAPSSPDKSDQPSQDLLADLKQFASSSQAEPLRQSQEQDLQPKR
jgi:hypothetical protein